MNKASDYLIVGFCYGACAGAVIALILVISTGIMEFVG